MKLLTIHAFAVHEREIPYQVLSNDDVILDFSLLEEYIEDVMVPNALNVVVCTTVPFLCCLFLNRKMLVSSSSDVMNRNDSTVIVGDVHCFLCTFAIAFAFDTFVNDPLKRYVGRLRPNFYGKCEFDLQTLQCGKEDIDDARMSFPSGHVHLAASSMTVLSLYLLGRAIRANQKSVVGEDAAMDLKHRLYMICSMTPILWTIFVAVAVVQDNMHFTSDVIAGGILGSFCGLFAYHLWYHPCFSTRAGLPQQFNRYQPINGDIDRGFESAFYESHVDFDERRLDDSDRF